MERFLYAHHYYESDMSNKILLFFTVVYSHTNLEERILIKNITIFCISCPTVAYDFNKLKRTVINKTFLPYLKHLGYQFGIPNSNEMVSLGHYYSFSQDGTFFQNELMKCSKSTDSNWLFSNISSSNSSMNIYPTLGSVNIWKSVIKNYIIVKEYVSECTNGKVHRKINYYASVRIGRFTGARLDTYGLPIHNPDRLNSHRIISCGIQGTSKLPFIELVRVFSKSVWVAIVTTLLFLIWFSKQLLNSGTTIKIIYPLKIFLEQGDPFTKMYLKRLDGRLIFSALSLATLVISNCYKSENVYRMVYPRLALGYEKLDELLRDNFSIYASTGIIFVRMDKIKISPELHPHWLYGNRSFTNTESSVFVHSSLLKHTKEELNSKERLLGEISILHFDVPKMLTTLIEDALVLFKVIANWDPWAFLTCAKLISRHYRMLENQILYDEISTCNKSALVLPEYMFGNVVSYVQKHSDNSDKIYIGKEKFFSKFTGFRITGNISPHLIRRIQAVRDSGLFEWTQNIFRNAVVKKHEETRILRPQKPNMRGNILVFFIVLLVGLSVSTSVHILERRKVILKYAFFVWTKILMSVRALLRRLKPTKCLSYRYKGISRYRKQIIKKK